MPAQPPEVAPSKTLFISRAGADAEYAAEIGRVLEAAGYAVALQQWDFTNANFIERIHNMLASGARVVGLLSPHYLQADYCSAEWQNALAGDPLNRKRRLILLRIAECEPMGLLAGLAYWDLVPIRNNGELLEAVVSDAVAEGRRSAAPFVSSFWRAPRTVVDHEAIRPTPSFTGREEELAALASAFTTESGPLRANAFVVIHGLGGMGKSSLAREYAWRDRGRYAIVWWLNAETESGIIDGLLRLGALFVRGLETVDDRRAAAQQVIATVLAGFEKPILLVFDNLDDEGLLRAWSPRSGTNVLVTSRNAAWHGEIAAIEMRTWTLEDAVAYLRRDCGRADLDESGAATLAEALGELPLALAHAAAYLRATRTVTPRRYLDRIAQQMASAPRNAEYPRSVFATFHEAIAESERQAPGAAALLCYAACFAPDLIPDELFRQRPALFAEGLRPSLGGEEAAVDLRSAVSDALRLDEALGALDRLSLATLSMSSTSYSMHRLVRLAAKDMLRDSAPHWINCALAALDAAFPQDVEFVHWPRCERLLPHALAALDVAGDTGSLLVASLALRCGEYLRRRGDYRAAEQLVGRTLAIRERALGSDDPDVAHGLNTMAKVYFDQGRYAQAERLYTRAVTIREASLGPDHPDVARSLHNLVGVYREQGRFGEAEAPAARALSILEKAFGPDHPDVALCLNNLAAAYREQGRNGEAEPLAARALAILEATLGPKHPYVTQSLTILAEEYWDQGRYGDAEPLFARALAIREEALGPDHPDVAECLSNLAAANRGQGSHAAAEQLAERALSIWENALGTGHPEFARGLHELALLRREQGRPDEAETLFARALAIREMALGSDHPLTRENRDDLNALRSLRAQALAGDR